MKRVNVIFGAGELGRKAIEYYGAVNIRAIIDNDVNKIGTVLEGIPIIAFDEFLKSRTTEDYVVVCATWKHTQEIAKQLLEAGVDEYTVFNMQLFEDVDLVLNEYEDFEGTSEEIWNKKIVEDGNREKVRTFVNDNRNDVPLFHEIEIETINRCNGVCSFCPVNVQKDIRVRQLMSEELFVKIINELEEMKYAGRVALFSNNEPLLDKRIVDLSEYARMHLPKAQIHMFTNGTLLTLEIFTRLIKCVDELIIDNYDQNLELIPNVKIVKEYIEGAKDESLRKKVKILLRKPDEILSSRGGDAPNRIDVMDVSEETCALPYCQMVVRPSGEVSLCCNDPYGNVTLGDLNKESLLEVWYGEKYQRVRECLNQGRGAFEHCKKCDTFMII